MSWRFNCTTEVTKQMLQTLSYTQEEHLTSYRTKDYWTRVKGSSNTWFANIKAFNLNYKRRKKKTVSHKI